MNKISAYNLSKYFKTKFVRFLHSISKASHDATSKTFKLVPIVDFSKNSEIDWEKPITDIDKQLYVKYKLTNEEIEFIEEMIKPM